MIESLGAHQNQDGGWPYLPGGSSWTEPTVFALLAGYTRSDESGRFRALEWLRKLQRPDGGWSPKPGVEQSTWVTALAALLPARDLGEGHHARAIRWLLDLTPANATLYARLQAWLSGAATAEPNAGWPWLPGTAAWATPTAIATLALAQQNRRNADPVLKSRMISARNFLLAHRCADGGWNHGAARALGVDAPSYPETTGTALLAVAGLDPILRSSRATLAPSIQCAENWWKNCRILRSRELAEAGTAGCRPPQSGFAGTVPGAHHPGCRTPNHCLRGRPWIRGFHRMNKISRRQMLSGTAGSLFLESCSRQPAARTVNPNAPKPLVSVIRAASYSQDIYDAVRRVLVEHKLNVKGQRVVLKPNLVEFDRKTAINTHPLLVHAALEAFRSIGAGDVRIAEGPGHRRDTLDLADAAGYFETVPGFEDLFTDLNLDEVSKRTLRQPFSKLSEVYLPNTILGADLIVSMPKMKTHHWVGATLSMKNFFGIIPGAIYGWPKNVLHWSGIHQCIVDLSSVPGRTFAIADGIVGMEGNGPIQGTPKNCGVMVAGRNLEAVDATCSRVMGIDPNKVVYLNAPDRPHYNDEAAIMQTGEMPQTVRTNFQLIKEFADLRLA